MKKILTKSILIMLFLSLLLGMTGCKKKNEVQTQNVETSAEATPTEEEKKPLTSEELANKIKEKNTNVGAIIVYDENTDPNKILGRPNEYISKVSFQDKRVNQYGETKFSTENAPRGGIIETFASETDTQRRKKYLETLTANIGALSQYMYVKGTYILRLTTDLTPTQAKEYEEMFNTIIE